MSTYYRSGKWNGRLQVLREAAKPFKRTLKLLFMEKSRAQLMTGSISAAIFPAQLQKIF